jgi:ribonucleoside-diphosphate reductase alpha chain
MIIRKRTGEYEAFDLNKVNKSVAVVTEANVFPAIARILERTVFDSSEQIAKIIEDYLMDAGLHDAARCFIRYRTNKSILPTVNKTQIRRIENWLSEYIIQSKYAKYSGESWSQIVERSRLSGVPDSAYAYVHNKRVLPSMRSLQFGGAAIQAKNERMFNCSYTPIDRIGAFGEILRLLLCGCGVGISVERKYTDCLPIISKNQKVIHHRIADSIEGWCEALDLMMVSPYFIEYDYSLIRAEGSPLITSGGLAPGHKGLKASLEQIRGVLDSANSRRLTSYEVWKIVCLASRAVLSGGIRRSSIICLFDKYDYEILGAKTGRMEDWMGLSNNTIALRSPDSVCVERALETALLYGEPGVARLEADYGINPCGEILIGPIVRDTGFCNLCEVRVDDGPDFTELLERVRAAYRIGLAQAEYATTDWSKRNKLLGISLNGCSQYQSEKDFENVARVRSELGAWCRRDGVLRCTCIKPSGTSSLVLGIHGSGIHYPHAHYYYRRIIESQVPELADSSNPGQIVLPLYCEQTTLEDIGLVEQLDLLDKYYKAWIGSDGHSISVTLTIRDGEYSRYKDRIVDSVNTGRVRALSFAPYGIEHKYKGAPRERTDSGDRVWNRMVNTFTEPDLSKLKREIGNACEGGLCSVKK